MDDDQIRRRRVLNAIIIGSTAMLVLLDGIVLLYSLREGAHYQGLPFGTLSLLAAFFIILYVISRGGFYDLASYLLIGTYLIGNSYAAYRWGVILPVAILTYALTIIVATILRGTKFGFLMTGLIAAFIIPLWYGQFYQIVPMGAGELRDADAIIFSIIYFLIMTVAWLYNREIEQSLQRAHNSELALKKERDLLEIRVQERTNQLRRAELERMAQLNRFAELGRLSSGLFHDIFNLLNAIALRDEDGSNPSLTHAFDTTRQIEDFMRAVRTQIDQRDAREIFSLAQGITHAIQLIDYKAKKDRVRIVFHHDPHKNVLYFDAPFKFQEVIINLLFNAIESYECLPHGDRRKRLITIHMDAGYETVTIRVEDNSCGMPSEVRAQIFEPFFTTKGKEKGIGIGLATVKKIVEEDFYGTITVRSEVNIGSSFIIEFPLKPKTDTPEDIQSPCIPQVLRA